MTHISQRQTQFSYFDQMLDHPVWKGSKILDFGGNVGGFLAGAGDEINHDDYWCLDVTKGAIEEGQHNFPRAHFVHFNRYSSYFNPDGVPYLAVPDLGLKFNIIIAFLSVPGLPPRTGILCQFDSTSDDPRGKMNLGSCVVIDEQVIMEPGDEYCQQKRRGRPGESYCSYFTSSYMTSLFPDATIRPPVARETQHCCILRTT